MRGCQHGQVVLQHRAEGVVVAPDWGQPFRRYLRRICLRLLPGFDRTRIETRPLSDVLERALRRVGLAPSAGSRSPLAASGVVDAALRATEPDDAQAVRARIAGGTRCRWARDQAEGWIP